MFFPGQIDELPPLITSAICMARIGANVLIVASGCALQSEEYLKSNGVILSIVKNNRPKNIIERIVLRIRVGVRLFLEKNRYKPDCIWYHGPFAMEYALIPGINKNSIIVAHSHELCDDEYLLKIVSEWVPKISRVVIVPEINRLWILKARSKSSAKFICIPNRPLEYKVNFKNDGATKIYFEKNGGSQKVQRFIIYQGAFMEDRCLKHLIRGFKNIEYDDVGLILMGGMMNGRFYDELKEIINGDERVVIMPRIPPPYHLEIAEGCVGGVLLYKPDRINNIYCAPNKIYEYAGVGIGMIFPEYPGLKYLNAEYEFGVFCDPLNEKSITNAIIELLEKSADHYRYATKRFLESSSAPEDIYCEVFEAIKEVVV